MSHAACKLHASSVHVLRFVTRPACKWHAPGARVFTAEEFTDPLGRKHTRQSATSACVHSCMCGAYVPGQPGGPHGADGWSHASVKFGANIYRLAWKVCMCSPETRRIDARPWSGL
eukprot:365203-Chlamydomonas_euryale.AAC.30